MKIARFGPCGAFARRLFGVHVDTQTILMIPLDRLECRMRSFPSL